MAYPYTPTTYAPNYFQQAYGTPPMQTPAPSATAANSGLVWVQGESGAKSYLVAPNNTVLLMDSETQKFYIKSADASGMPLPLRVFDYKEVGAAEPIDPGKYVTREELEKRFAELKAEVNSHE